MPYSVFMDSYSRLAGANFPVFIRPDLAPALVSAQGTSPVRAVVCSIPKSGTYMYGALLKSLGLADCGVHLREDGFTDYRFSSLEHSRTQHRSLHASCPLETAVSLMHPGQFSVGHLACNDHTKKALQGLKVIFTCRDLRDAMVSQMRFFAKNERGTSVSEGWGRMQDGPEKMLHYIRHHGDFFMETRCASMMGWIGQPGTLVCSFETLYGDNGENARLQLLTSLCTHLGMAIPASPAALFTTLLGTETITSSGSRTDRSVFWDDRVEDYFRSKNGPAMNRTLGYSD
jgi:hypothetical protein